MSLSLIKRGLELIEEDFDSKLDSGLKKSKKINSKSKKKGSGTLSERKVKNALASYEKRSKTDQTKRNLEVLHKADAKLNLNASAIKVKDFQIRRLLREAESAENTQQKKTKKESGETSVFSEEDFEKINAKWLSLM